MSTRNFHWHPTADCVMAETDQTGAAAVTYTHSASTFGPLVSEVRSGAEAIYHCDSLGSTRMMTTTSGTVTDTFAYDAWGGTGVRTGSSGTRCRWVGTWGYQYDGTGNTYYVRARTYHTTVARWTSRDPLWPLAQEFQYVAFDNSPGSVIDPSGLDCGKKPNGVVNRRIPTGIFRAFGIGKYEPLKNEVVGSKIGSSMSVAWRWDPDPDPFACAESKDCCRCLQIGFLQIAKYDAAWSDGGKRTKNWFIDGMPYLEGPLNSAGGRAATSPVCSGFKGLMQSRIEMNDSPNFPYSLWWYRQNSGTPRLINARHDFETCVYCVKGAEGVAQSQRGGVGGVTVYGCFKWGHQIEWNASQKAYLYLRWVDTGSQYRSTYGSGNSAISTFPDFSGIDASPLVGSTII